MVTDSRRAPAFDIVTTYTRLLREDEDLTMPIAAIEALILALSSTPSSTVSETLDLVSRLTIDLKRSVPNSISLSAGTDLFQQYLISNLQQRSTTSSSSSSNNNIANPKPDFEQIRAHLVQNGKLFVSRAKAARSTIANLGQKFIRDGNVVLTNGGSRVAGSLLRAAADSHTRFKVIYVLSSAASPADKSESTANIAALRSRSIPVATIPATAVAFCLDQVTQIFVGAEGVVENGGIISRMGTYQIGMLAKASGKPFYVVSETHKFVRLYPLGQRDLGLEQKVLEFRTGEAEEGGDSGEQEVSEGFGGAFVQDEAVDYTPPQLITGIITESGVLLPSAVSEELIKIWF